MTALQTRIVARKARSRAGQYLPAQVHYLQREIGSGLDEAIAAQALMRNFKLTGRKAVDLLHSNAAPAS